jgi:thymidylate synthase
VFEAYRRITHTAQPVDAAVTAALHLGHRWLLAARWPDRITSGIEAGQPA